MEKIGDVWLCTFVRENHSRCEFTTCLVFRRGRFEIRRSQDYETQAKIERDYIGADTFLAEHPEYQEQPREAVKKHTAENPDDAKDMRAAMARMKNL